MDGEHLCPLTHGELDAHCHRRLELGATFLCYLEHGCNVSQTARALHLHRQSLIHRLHRLEEVTGLSLENYNDRFLLELCVRLGAGFSLEEA